MKLEYRCFWITDKWKPLKSTNLRSAVDEIDCMGPQWEESQIREVTTGKMLSLADAKAMLGCDRHPNFGP